MSKISCDFKLKDLFAMKHALETTIGMRQYMINTIVNGVEKEQHKVDMEHEKKIVDYIVEVINRYKTTEAHYDEIR